MVNEIIDDVDNLMARYNDTRAMIMEQTRNISITVASETDLKNLNRKFDLIQSVLFLDMQINEILNYFRLSLSYIDTYKKLVNEMDSPKDKYLISKLIQNEINDIEGLYESCKIRMEQNTNEPNTMVFNLIREIWQLVQTAYIDIKNINN